MLTIFLIVFEVSAISVALELFYTKNIFGGVEAGTLEHWRWCESLVPDLLVGLKGCLALQINSGASRSLEAMDDVEEVMSRTDQQQAFTV